MTYLSFICHYPSSFRGNIDTSRSINGNILTQILPLFAINDCPLLVDQRPHRVLGAADIRVREGYATDDRHEGVRKTILRKNCYRAREERGRRVAERGRSRGKTKTDRMVLLEGERSLRERETAY